MQCSSIELVPSIAITAHMSSSVTLYIGLNVTGPPHVTSFTLGGSSYQYVYRAYTECQPPDDNSSEQEQQI